MACPNQGVLTKSITFTIRTLDSGDVPAWADAAPTYSVYEETTLIGNLVGTDVSKIIKTLRAEGKIHSPKRCFYEPI